MKTIKIIDLLNKIANKEEIPTKIKFREMLFKYDDSIDIYCEYINDKDEKLWEFISLDSKDINEEVEILEEEKRITGISVWYGLDGEHNDEILDCMCTKLKDKVNELIDAVNELNKK